MPEITPERREERTLTRTLHSYAKLPASSSFGVNFEVRRLPDADAFGLQASATGPAGIWIAGCKHNFDINSTFHSLVRVEQAKVMWSHPPRKYLLCTKSMRQLLGPGVPFREHTRQQTRTQRNFVQPRCRGTGESSFGEESGRAQCGFSGSWYRLNPGMYPLGGEAELRPSAGHCSNLIAILKGPLIGKTDLLQVNLKNVALENI